MATFAAAAILGVLTLDAGVSKAVNFELGDDTSLDFIFSLLSDGAVAWLDTQKRIG